MEKKTEIKKLVIEVDGKEISLPVDKAKKLYEALGELFAKKIEIKEIHKDHYYPQWYWRQYTLQDNTAKPLANNIWCSSNDTKFTLQANSSSAKLLCQVK